MSRIATVRKPIETIAEATAETITTAEPQPQVKEQVLVKEQSREEVVQELIKNKEYAKMSKEELIKHFGSKSAAIRGLNAELGWKPGPISKALGILYQHARNVLLQPLKRQIAQDRATAAAAAAAAATASATIVTTTTNTAATNAEQQ